jgi:serine/threonine protein kinase
MSDRSTDTAVTGFSPQAPDDDLAPGTVVENFQIECTLGRGGMSTVYGAVHTVIGKRGAIKVLKRELCTDDKEVERFVQEARAVNQIGHANIVDVFAFGVLPDGRSYLVMEWLVGQSLRSRMRRGQLSRNEVREITLDIVRALEAAHAQGIIHRDLKPDNVFLVEAPGEKPRAKLLDFGVAKLTGEGRLDRTRVGSMLGTPQYLAPEQARGEAVLASDIYTLGVMLFELAAGRPPFVGENSLEVVAMHMTEPPPKLSSLVGGVTPELDALVAAMLAKEPAERPSLARIKAELEQLGAKPKAPATGMRTTLTTRKSSTKLALVIAGLVGALAMVIVFFVVLSAKSETTDEPREATKEERRPERREANPHVPKPPEPTPPAPVPVVERGSLVIAWAGTEKVTFTVDGKPASPNAPIDLAPGTYKLEVQRNRKRETKDIVITAGNRTRVPIQPTTRARSRTGDDSLDPLNNGPR